MLKHRHVYVLTNATVWVEARWGDHIHRTPNLTLYLNEAGKRPRGRAGCQHRLVPITTRPLCLYSQA